MALDVSLFVPLADVMLQSCSRVDLTNTTHAPLHILSMQAFWREGDSLWVKIATSSAILRYIVPKGYIAVDGTSLTVCEVARPGSAAAVEAGCKAAQQDGQDGEGYFTFMLIAYTQAHIILPRKALGETVNLEADVMGKYAESAVANSTAAMQAALAAMVQQVEERLSSSIAKIDERLSAVEARVSKLQ